MRELLPGSSGETALDVFSDIMETCVDMVEVAQADGAGINERIAQRVRELRKRQTLTLDELAARSQVSRSMLSLIERGGGNPTAAVLERIAGGLNVPLASLFDAEDSVPDPVSRPKDRLEWRDPESGYIRRNISPANFPSNVHIVEVVFPAGASVTYDNVPDGYQTHQQVWVLEGSMEISVGDATYHLKQDDCLAMGRREPVTFRNLTRRRARYVVVIATFPHL